MLFFKKCKHQWFNVGEYSSYGYDDPLCRKENNNRVNIYCPKCDKRKDVSTNEWSVLKEIQKVKVDFGI